MSSYVDPLCPVGGIAANASLNRKPQYEKGSKSYRQSRKYPFASGLAVFGIGRESEPSTTNNKDGADHQNCTQESKHRIRHMTVPGRQVALMWMVQANPGYALWGISRSHGGTRYRENDIRMGGSPRTNAPRVQRGCLGVSPSHFHLSSTVQQTHQNMNRGLHWNEWSDQYVPQTCVCGTDLSRVMGGCEMCAGRLPLTVGDEAV
jgi:hypothetical protein